MNELNFKGVITLGFVGLIVIAMLCFFMWCIDFYRQPVENDIENLVKKGYEVNDVQKRYENDSTLVITIKMSRNDLK